MLSKKFDLDGIFRYVKVNSDILNTFLVDTTIACLGLHLYLVVLMCIYRCAQTIENTNIQIWLSTRKYAFVHLFIFLIFALLVLYPINAGMLTDQEIKKLYNESFPDIYDQLKNKNMMGIKVRMHE